MIRFQHSIEIARKPEEVFAYLSNLERLPKWQKGVVHSRVTTPGPIRVGTCFEETAKVGPWRLESKCEVVAFDSPRHMRFAALGKQIDYEGAFTVEPCGSGARLLVEGSARLKGAWRLMQPLLAGDLKRETQTELQTIRRLLEGTTGPATATA